MIVYLLPTFLNIVSLVIFYVHFTLMVHVQHLLSNASNILLILAGNVHVSQPFSAMLNTVVLMIFIFVGILMMLLLLNLSSACSQSQVRFCQACPNLSFAFV